MDVCFPKLYRSLIFFLATLLLAVNCKRVDRFLESTSPYHTETYKEICNEWSREARIHRGLEVELIVSATFKSEEFRRAYAAEYAEAYRLTPGEKKRFVEDQLKTGIHGHEFMMASFVPEKKWDDFDKLKSVWKLYLVNDQQERVVPIEVRKVKRQDAVIPHFFPYVTPWKSIYTVRFPCKVPATNQPIIKNSTNAIKLVITGVHGTAEMGWDLR